MNQEKFKSPLKLEAVKEFVKENPDKFKDTITANDASIISQHEDLWPLLEDLTKADQALFWRLLRSDIVDLKRLNKKIEAASRKPAYLNAKDVDVVQKKIKKPLSPNAIANIILGVGLLIIAIVVLLLFKACTKDTPEKQRFNQEVAVMGVVQNYLKDGSSAKFRDQYYNCGLVNAKNSFGAYTGYRRFVVVGGRLPFIEGESAGTPEQFQELWQKNCQ